MGFTNALDAAKAGANLTICPCDTQSGQASITHAMGYQSIERSTIQPSQGSHLFIVDIYGDTYHANHVATLTKPSKVIVNTTQHIQNVNELANEVLFCNSGGSALHIDNEPRAITPHAIYAVKYDVMAPIRRNQTMCTISMVASSVFVGLSLILSLMVCPLFSLVVLMGTFGFAYSQYKLRQVVFE